MALASQAAGTIRLSALRKIEDYRDRALSIHETNVARVCDILSQAVGLDEHFRKPLVRAAELHDIGKLAISDQLLNKAAALGAEEMAIMRTHCQIGHDILRDSGEDALDFAADIALSHHESFDGTGYPRGLKGEAIPLASRIVSLCDVYDALRGPRAYRPAMAHAEAVAIMTAPEGRSSRKRFDPMVLDAFLRCTDMIKQVYPALSRRRSWGSARSRCRR